VRGDPAPEKVNDHVVAAGRRGGQPGVDGLLASTGLTPAQVREKIMADRPLWSDQIFARAHERGEIDLDRIPPAVLTMPFDLMRHDMLMTYKPIPPERVLAIVDDLFVPLVALNDVVVPINVAELLRMLE
jgi:Tetracyclin repressor-like, C-terminal domain